MADEIPPTHKSNSGKPSWVIGLVILACAAAALFLAMMAGAFIILKPVERITVTSEVESTSLPIEELDPNAEPLFGHADLLRAYKPDPHIVAVAAGGNADTTRQNMDCGFTTHEPVYGFRLFGGASETFLRIYFRATDGSDATLVVLTPTGEWLCARDSSYGSGADPVIDIEFAPSGEYAIWVGLEESGSTGKGSLYITQSAENTP